MSSRVLVYQLGSIGDTVVTIPALRAVRRHFGSTALIVMLHNQHTTMVKATPADLLAGGPEVNQFISFPPRTMGWRGYVENASNAWRLHRWHFDTVVYLAHSERPACKMKRSQRFFALCRIPKQIGFHAFPHEVLYPRDAHGQPAWVPHEAHYLLQRLQMDGIDISVERDLSQPFLTVPAPSADLARQWLAARRRYPQRPLVAICPGSNQPANLWPIERFVEIGRRLTMLGQYELLVVGGPAERDIGATMVTAWGDGINAAGQLPVLGSAALLGECAFLVGLNTGTTHLAAAAGVPCVALYGQRNNPGRWDPMGAGHVVIRHAVACAGCRARGTLCTEAEVHCMTGIGVEVVWQAVQQMIRQGNEPQHGSSQPAGRA